MLMTNELSNNHLVELLVNVQKSSGFNLVLLSDDQGFPIASSGVNEDENETQAAVLSMVRIFLGKINEQMNLAITSEFSLVDKNGNKLIVRPFIAGKSELLLAVLLPNTSLSYKRWMNTTVRNIQAVWKL